MSSSEQSRHPPDVRERGTRSRTSGLAPDAPPRTPSPPAIQPVSSRRFATVFARTHFYGKAELRSARSRASVSTAREWELVAA